MPFERSDVSQEKALRQMAELVVEALNHKTVGPQLINAARAIVADCDARDDRCEAQAIFDAVKYGTTKIVGLKNGLRYVSDPRTFDYYQRADKMLQACARGACAGDCDDHAILNVTLLCAIGFKAGLRAWGPKIGKREYSHVYAVVALPKNPSNGWPDGYSGHGFDTSTMESDLGWEPKKGEVLTVWIEAE